MLGNLAVVWLQLPVQLHAQSHIWKRSSGVHVGNDHYHYCWAARVSLLLRMRIVIIIQTAYVIITVNESLVPGQVPYPINLTFLCN